MRPSKEVKKNKGFKRAFIAGSLIIIILSLLISWITVSIIRGMEKRLPKEENSKTDDSFDPSSLDKDTVFVDRIKEVRKTDTVYRYIQPPKPKHEETSVVRRDTSSK